MELSGDVLDAQIRLTIKAKSAPRKEASPEHGLFTFRQRLHLNGNYYITIAEAEDLFTLVISKHKHIIRVTMAPMKSKKKNAALEVTPPKRTKTMAINQGQKQALIDNLQLEGEPPASDQELPGRC